MTWLGWLAVALGAIGLGTGLIVLIFFILLANDKDVR